MFLVPLCSHPPSILSPQQGLIWSFPYCFLPFPESYMNGIVQYVAFWVWLLSLSIMFLKFIQMIACISSLLLLLSSMKLYRCTTVGKYMFNIIKNFQTVFQSGSTILRFHKQCMTVPVALHTTLSVSGMVSFLFYSSGYQVVSCYGFNSYFHSNW